MNNTVIKEGSAGETLRKIKTDCNCGFLYSLLA